MALAQKLIVQAAAESDKLFANLKVDHLKPLCTKEKQNL